ncbi:MAG TPA: acetate/propionate family kinase [Acidimicrobiia bacterium]
MRILVVNAGSSSLKLRVIGDDDEVVHSADMPAIGRGSGAKEIASALAGWGEVEGVGHRIVHGGNVFSGPVVVDRDVVQELTRLVDLAPLHQPMSLAALDAVTAALPSVPAVACFDTAFHADLPLAAATYPLPRQWREQWGLRRFGFHGLSHSYAAAKGIQLMGRAVEGTRIVTCHLGAGASLAAVRDGRSIDTTMGFTPLEGLMMATRSGSIDPGLLLWLANTVGMSGEDLAKGLEEQSGLLGLAGTADMREVLTASEARSSEARLAIDVYLHRLRSGIAAMTASMGGLHGLVFTGGVGENSAVVREGALEGLQHLGLVIDPLKNGETSGDRTINPPDAAVQVVVVSAREDLQIAREVRQLLAPRT